MPDDQYAYTDLAERCPDNVSQDELLDALATVLAYVEQTRTLVVGATYLNGEDLVYVFGPPDQVDEPLREVQYAAFIRGSVDHE